MEQINRYPNSSEYSGVLSQSGEFRLIVGVKGTRFEVQRQWGRNWVCLTHGKTLPACLRNLSESDYPGASAAAYEMPGLDDLPDNPGDVIRPWADYEQESEQAAFQAEIGADVHAATIWQHKDVRALAPWGRSAEYRLQKRTKVKGWTDVTTAASVRGLLGAVSITGEKRPFGQPVVKSAEIFVALNALANVLASRDGSRLDPERVTSVQRGGKPRLGAGARPARSGKPAPSARGSEARKSGNG